MIKIHLHNSKVDDIHAFIRHARWKWRKSRTRMARFREFPRQESRYVLRSIEDARLYTVKAWNQSVNVVKRAVWFAARSVLDRYASAEDQARYFDIENESYAENKFDLNIISILPCFLLRCELSCIWLCEFPRIRSDFWSLEEEAEDQIWVAKKPNWSTRFSRLSSREREFTKKIESLIRRRKGSVFRISKHKFRSILPFTIASQFRYTDTWLIFNSQEPNWSTPLFIKLWIPHYSGTWLVFNIPNKKYVLFS